MAETRPETEVRKEFFSSYVEYNKTLRTWFVTFGVGGPLLLLANPTLTKTLVETQALGSVVYAFLIGCAFQICIAMLNKIAGWYGYYYSDYDEHDTTTHDRPNRLINILVKLNDKFWIDILADILSIICFAFAVVRLVAAVIP